MPWVVVVAPRGDVVRLDSRYDQYSDAASLFGMALDGQAEQGMRVTLNGRHVALAWREEKNTGTSVD